MLAQCKSTANQNRLIAVELKQIKEQQKKLLIVSNIVVALFIVILLSLSSFYKDDLEQ